MFDSLGFSSAARLPAVWTVGRLTGGQGGASELYKSSSKSLLTLSVCCVSILSSNLFTLASTHSLTCIQIFTVYQLSVLCLFFSLVSKKVAVTHANADLHDIISSLFFSNSMMHVCSWFSGETNSF